MSGSKIRVAQAPSVGREEYLVSHILKLRARRDAERSGSAWHAVMRDHMWPTIGGWQCYQMPDLIGQVLDEAAQAWESDQGAATTELAAHKQRPQQQQQ